VIAIPGDLHPDGCSASLRSRDNPSGYDQDIVWLSCQQDIMVRGYKEMHATLTEMKLTQLQP
jgi:hypothetical protein